MGAKVLLVGINSYPTMPLRGCINDIENMRALLKQQYNVADENVRLLLDADATKASIEEKLRWLAQPDDGDGPPLRVFHFSGHGTHVVDRNGDEPDGRDEALVPYDFTSVGAITDDILRQAYGQFAPETHLLLTMDCCHSGTNTRAPRIDDDDDDSEIFYRFVPNSYEEEQAFDEAAQRAQAARDRHIRQEMRDVRADVSDDEWDRRFKAAASRYDKKHFGIDTLQGNVVLIAACRDDQTAADARIGGSFNGALTYYLAEVLRKGAGRLTYGDLITQVGKRLYDNKFRQIPQLECSDTNQTCAFLNIAL